MALTNFAGLRLPNVITSQAMRGFGGFGDGGSFSDQSSKGLSSSKSTSGSAYSKDALARINRLYPQLQDRYSALAGSAAKPFASLLQETGGTPMNFGQTSPFPDVTVGGVWSPQQVDERVNTMRAQGDLGLAGEQRRLRERTAGRGFGSNSPLAQEMAQNMAAQNYAANVQGENDLRFNAADVNAKHLLETQKAAIDRSRQMNAADIARMGLASQDDLRRRELAVSREGQGMQFGANQMNALLEAMGFYNQPLPFSNATSSSNQSSKGQSQSVNPANYGGYGGGGGGSKGGGSIDPIADYERRLRTPAYGPWDPYMLSLISGGGLSGEGTMYMG